jgi:hypothetical protein
MNKREVLVTLTQALEPTHTGEPTAPTLPVLQSLLPHCAEQYQGTSHQEQPTGAAQRNLPP